MNENILSPEKELELINTYTRAPLKAEDVYTFSVTLCDNEIDRDFEKFTPEALEKLGALFLGKTGISDHSMRSEDQIARIFHTWIEKSQNKVTSEGNAYIALKAKAYMLRTETNKDLIAEIDAGIKKEVSIGCAMASKSCSICGKELKIGRCEHIKGKTYGKKLCHTVLDEPTDAYEWSFVAVPAQRNAGVTKSFGNKEEKNLENPISIIKSMTEDTLITLEQAEAIKSYIGELQQLASEAAQYKQHLTQEIGRLSMLVMPKVNTKKFLCALKEMSLDDLKQFKTDLEAQARQIIPPMPQLKPAGNQKISDNTAFKI